MQRVSSWESNKKQAAAFFGVSVQAIDGWINRGCPCEKRGRSLNFYLPEVVQWRYSQDEDGAKLDLTAERARLAKEQADKTAMDNAKLRGEMIPVAAVRELLERILIVFKTHILAIPSKLAPLVLGLKTTAEARDAIDEHLHGALNELSRLSVSNLGSASGPSGSKTAAKVNGKRVG